MKLICKQWGNDPVQNPRGYPAGHPYDSMEIEDRAPVPPGWTEISREEYRALVDQNFAAVAAINDLASTEIIEVERWKLRAILKSQGLFNSIEAVINAVPEPNQSVLREKWAGQERVVSTHPTILQLGSAIGLSRAQIVGIFKAAAALQ